MHPAVPVGNPQAAIAPTSRDLLQDLVNALGDETMPAADVPALLAKLAPDWAPYRALTGKQQRAELRVKVPSTGNKFPVNPVAIRAAVGRRAAELANGA